MDELDWLLASLASTVLGVRSVVILSPDGLPLGRSAGLSENEAGHLSALAAGAQSLTGAVGARQIAYEMAVLVKRVGQHMIVNPRFPLPGPVAG